MTIRVISPAGDRDRENLYRFLYNVWIWEYDRELPGTDHGNEQVKDELDASARHFMAVDTEGQIAGCVRVNRISQGIPDPSLSSSLGVEALTRLFDPDRVAYISHLAVSPAHRGGTVISLVLAALFRHMLETGISVAACYCRMNLVSLYHRMGMRPYHHNFKRNGMMQVPLVGCINDREYLKSSGSPLHRLLPPGCNDRGRAARILKEAFPLFTTPEFTRTSTRNLWAQLAHAAPEQDSGPAAKLLQGLDPDSLAALLPGLPRIVLSHNETVQINRAREAAMGIVISGALGLGVGDEADPHFVYVIQPGEPFGELVSLTRIRSSSVLFALEKSEVLLLPGQLFDRLGQKDPGTALHLYKNLLAILAKRAAATNALLAGHLSPRCQHATRIRDNAVPGAGAGDAASRKESYHFDTLDDPDGELDRLSTQARIARALELKVLEEVGVKNGDSILDLGSGPGITSGILARRFTDSRVMGVEPEKALISKARAMAREKKLDNCRFLEGTAQSIPLADKDIDFSYARLLFQHIPDPMTCLVEMKRVTRSGGIVCVLDVDDGTIFIHPRQPEWERVEKRVARAQAAYGGDRHVGRKLLGYFQDAGFDRVRVDIVPVTTQMLGAKAFFDIVFGFKQQHLKRAGDWNRETGEVFSRIRKALSQKGAFASENMFVAHGLVP